MLSATADINGGPAVLSSGDPEKTAVGLIEAERNDIGEGLPEPEPVDLEEDDLHDLTHDVDDPLPAGVPGQRIGTDEQVDVPVRDEVHFPDPAAETDPAAVAAIAAKLGFASTGNSNAGV